MSLIYPKNARPRLLKLLHTAQSHPFYRDQLHKLNIDPHTNLSTILSQLPFTTRQDLYNFTKKSPKLPYQPAYILKSRADQTGNEIFFPFSLRDFQNMVKVEEDNFTKLGLGAGKTVSILNFSSQHIPSMILGLINIGCTYVPISGDLENIVTQLTKHKVDTIMTHPSTVRQLLDYLKLQNSVLKLSHIITIGAQIEDQPLFKNEIKQTISAKHTDIIGSTEFCTYAAQIPNSTLYYFLTDNFIVEIVDPVTLQPSNEGEIVLTSLWHQDIPFIRYRTQDYIKISDEQNMTFTGILKRIDQLTKLNSTLISLNELNETITYALLYQKPTDRILWRLFKKPQIFTIIKRRYQQDQIHIFIDQVQFRKSRRRKVFIEKAVLSACDLKPVIHFIPQHLIPKAEPYPYHDHRELPPSKQARSLLDII